MRCVPHTSCGGAGPLTSPHRTEHPYVVLVAHDLALRHQDLEQSAMVGFILAARRYAPERGGFRPFARHYANGKVRHFQRDRGFLIKLSPSWRGAACQGPQAAGRRRCPRRGGPEAGGG
jgi:DNA-directed RNA polymerase specialized sigma subunit